MTDFNFVFVFLPLTLTTVIIKPKWRKYALLFFSLCYYAYSSPKFILLFTIMLIINLVLTYILQACCNSKILSKLLLISGIIWNVSILFYYKYSNWFVEEYSRFSGKTFNVEKVLLPVGISFFVFKSISLLADVYTGTIKLSRNPVYSALYLSFFGQIVSGPICRYGKFYETLYTGNDKYFDWDFFSQGTYLFMKGFLKKILLADMLNRIVTEVFAMDIKQTSASLLWLGAISYSLQLYYDFSGYSDMAIGIGKMYGIHCLENFNYPYAAKSISDFWRRWHISLGTWFRDYVYIPLGGSRVSPTIRRYFNLLVVWLLTGIWHGSNFTFLIWGFGYFIVIAVEKTLRLPELLKTKWNKVFYRIVVLMFINFQWVIFNSVDLFTGFHYLKGMIISCKSRLADIRTLVLLKEYGIVIVAAIIFAFPVIPYIKKHCFHSSKKLYTILDIVFTLSMATLFIFALSFVIAGQNNPFLYGNF